MQATQALAWVAHVLLSGAKVPLGNHGCMSRSLSALPGSGAGKTWEIRRHMASLLVPALPDFLMHRAAKLMERSRAVQTQHSAMHEMR